MSRYRLPTFNGLPGVKGTLRGPMVNSVTAALKALRRHRACSDVGDHGAIMVWIDDEGDYRCAFCRFQQTVDSHSFRTKTMLKDWLTDWWPKQRQQP